MKSVSNLIKEDISKILDKQKICCSFSMLYGMMLCGNVTDDNKITFSTNAENARLFSMLCDLIYKKKKIFYEVNNKRVSVGTEVVKYSTIAEIKTIFKCKNCLANFIKGVFIFYGTLSDPNKMYRLDISINNELLAKELLDLLNSDLLLNFKLTLRNGKYVVYTKSDDSIASLLGLIGANTYAYEIINSKIEREVRNVANRITNCDSANINRALVSSQKYCDVINKLKEEGHFSKLPDDLKEIAIKRITYPSLSLIELGNQFNPSLSKTFLYRKLEKIIQFYERIKDQ